MPWVHGAGAIPRWIRQLGASCDDLYRSLLPLLAPAGLLWPYLLGALVVPLLLSTAQGEAIAADQRARTWSEELPLAASVTLASMLVMLGAALVLLSGARRTEPGEQRIEDSWTRENRTEEIVVAAFWIVGLGAAYAAPAGNGLRSWGVAALCALPLALACWLTVRVARDHAVDDGPLRAVVRQLFRHRLWLAALVAAVAVFPLLAGALALQHSPTVFSKAGTVPVVLMGAAALATLVASVFIAIPRCIGAPWMGWIVFAVVAVTHLRAPASFDEANPLLKEGQRRADVATLAMVQSRQCDFPPPEARHEIAARAREVPPGQRADAYFVSAEGGGIRAAYWTALSLERADAASDGWLAQHIATLSGVSGGSLGIAAWLAARDLPHLDSAQRIRLLHVYLTFDFLTPLVGGLLLLDAPRLLFRSAWPSATRDQVFELALASRWEQLTASDFFYRTASELCVRGFRRTPAITFHATDALTGSPVQLGPSISNRATLEASSIWRVPVAQAVHLSARFPFLSPASDVSYVGATQRALPEFAHRARYLRLVDGGYFDNTGLSTTQAAINASVSRPIRPLIFHLANDPGVPCLPPDPEWPHKVRAQVRQMFEAFKVQPDCSWELEEADRAFKAEPLQWLTTPMQAMFAVRRQLAKREVGRIMELTKRSAPTAEEPRPRTWDEVRERIWRQRPASAHWRVGDIWSAELAAMGGPVDLSPVNDSMLERDYYAAQELVGDARSLEVDRLIETASQRVRSARVARAKQRCEVDAVLAPPLGWTLDARSASLLSCLAERAAVAQFADLRVVPASSPAVPSSAERRPSTDAVGEQQR